MSRGGGGFRGRGRGRGGGPERPAIPGMPRFDVDFALRAPVKHSGVLYPPLENVQTAVLPKPSQFEDAILAHTAELDDILSKGLYELGVNGERGAPWRLPEARKVVGIEIESYSDRLKPASAGPSKLNPIQLRMDESFFPPELWHAYFYGDNEASGAASKKKTKKRKRLLDDDEEGGQQQEDEAEGSSRASSDEGDFDFEDESDHQDYDVNYFDNGEGDDDEGGDEDADGGGFDD